ncbi:transcription elongation factor B polypeptide 3 [Odontomachus brunneus]|uniref:transcription elongation factor B polypeptide 3 n=1 Tax=Odontomachus brunneus TaxID=486640 RepID=UPI0013F2101E|nr:transcription elongation factor B polypeptide 3 [Odontomachus brunneus]
MSVINKIHHYQRNIEKCGDNLDRILHCITKLYNLPVTVQHLQETGVGRTVNSLRKYDGAVGDAAKVLVAKWKAMVVDEYSSGDDEDEVGATAESCGDNHNSYKSEEAEDNVLDQEQKLKHAHEESKDDMSAEHSVKHLSKSKEQNPKDTEDKHRRHEKNSHLYKHSQNEVKSKESRSSKSSSRKDETHKSREHNHSKNDNLEKASDRLMKNDENSTDKRIFDSSSLKKENKRSKLSDNRNNDETPQVLNSEKNHSSSRSSEIKIKVEDDKDKSNVKQDKRSSQEESRSSSSKLKSQNSSSKTKDNSERHKHKKEHADHKKLNTKKDSNHHSSKEISESRISSSSNDHIKSQDKDKKREHKEDRSSHGKKKEIKMRLSQEMTSNEGIDCNSGASFAEALGMCTMPQPSRKRNHNSNSSRKATKTEVMSPPSKKKMLTVKIEPDCNDEPSPPSLLASNIKLEPLNVDLASTLPEISPNYKPLPHINPVQRKEEAKFVDDIILVKNQRTKVYSGNKVGYTSVPSLCELSMRVLIENIDALEFTGGVPYDIIKPVLERATPDQLFTLEHYNPYLIEDTGTLWQFHCNREFRNKERQEMESWREMYMRCLDEREAKLKTLTANIKQSIDKSVPVRSAKLAYVDNVVKPPRNVLKKQAKYGTANDTPATVSSIKKKLASGGGANNATNIVVPSPAISRFKMSTSNSVKKTKAPLMAKALQLVKGRYKR